MPWILLDEETGQPYLARSWNSRTEAEFERAVLLRGFPPGGHWHKRLQVIEGNAIPERKPRDRARRSAQMRYLQETREAEAYDKNFAANFASDRDSTPGSHEEP